MRSSLPSLLTSMVSSPRIDLLATFADPFELITIIVLNGDQFAKGAGDMLTSLQHSPPATKTNQGDTLRESPALCQGYPEAILPAEGMGPLLGLTLVLFKENLPPDWAPAQEKEMARRFLVSDRHYCRAVTTSTPRIHGSHLMVNKAPTLWRWASQLFPAPEGYDISDYLVSKPFQGSIYLVQKHRSNFHLFHKNQHCRKFGGYLVELNSLEEEDYVQKLVNESNNFGKFVFTGANDIKRENSFFFYNSKQPMPTLRWKPGNPDNWKNEDCVDINWYGINDRRCNQYSTYICEIKFIY
ncbi:Cd209 antigen [Plakobranchus ocellatus]|uniref:Cd209 antigen n=1 Tax=Plakobranchus ocellatus TaxID=259542 RepID=A0AAV4BBS0_9GAST|nr:Cd209 antigen [Plakobranchus ocellatus]